MAIRSGLMRARVHIQNPSETLNALNEKGVEWVTLLENVRARKTWRSGNESAARSGHYDRTGWEFQIRYVAGITAESRIINDGKVFNIISIENVQERNHELLIMCNEVSRREIRGI